MTCGNAGAVHPTIDTKDHSEMLRSFIMRFTQNLNAPKSLTRSPGPMKHMFDRFINGLYAKNKLTIHLS